MYSHEETSRSGNTRRDRSHSAPALTHSQSGKRRLSDLFLNLVNRARSGSLPLDNNHHGSTHSLQTSHSTGVHTSPYGPKAFIMPRRNSNSQVHAVDFEVYESLERLNQELADDFRIDRESQVGAIEELCLPPPPPLKATDEKNEGTDIMEPTCLICLGKFTQRKPPVQIPCSSQCNLAPVHARCIYEWKEQRAGPGNLTGSCPLCRALLLSLDYLPPDPLATKTLFMHSARKSFVSRPVPKAAGMVRSYIRVVGTGNLTSTPIRYEMYLQAPTTRKYPNVPLPPLYGSSEGDQLLMTAKRKTNLRTGCSVIDVSLDQSGKDYSRNGQKLLASVRGSFLGLDYTITAPCRYDFHRESKQTLELGSIRFEQNRIGSGAGPRRISICLPAVRESPEVIHEAIIREHKQKSKRDFQEEEDDDNDEDDDDELHQQIYETMEYKPASKKESLRQVIRRTLSDRRRPGAATTLPNPLPNERFIFAKNRKPYYLESIAAFSLDFFGRVTLPSNKNCLLTCEDNNNSSANAESNILLFGKIGIKGRNADAAVYTLDFQWPLSPLQAFSIALASCDRKFGCA